MFPSRLHLLVCELILAFRDERAEDDGQKLVENAVRKVPHRHVVGEAPGAIAIKEIKPRPGSGHGPALGTTEAEASGSAAATGRQHGHQQGCGAGAH